MEINDTLILSLGSNLGDRKAHIIQAYAEIEYSIGKILKKSSFYENEAVGFESDSLFLNTCCEVQTSLTPNEILSKIQLIEIQLGRTSKSKDGNYLSRIIDIDIIFFGELVYTDEKLTIPHELFRNRLFVLIPLLDIAKNKIDPISQLTVNQIIKLHD